VFYDRFRDVSRATGASRSMDWSVMSAEEVLDAFETSRLGPHADQKNPASGWSYMPAVSIVA
jgi:hypothetical protein